MRDYYFQTWYVQAASRVAKQLNTEDLKKLGNIKKVSIPPQNDTPARSLPPKMKILSILAKDS